MHRVSAWLRLLCVSGSLQLSAVAQQEVDVSPMIGVSLGGQHSATFFGNVTRATVTPGLTLAYEVSDKSRELIGVGGGFQYLFSHTLSPERLGSFKFGTVYGLIRLQFAMREEKPLAALVGNLGYNVIYSGDEQYRGSIALRGRLYLAGGMRLYIHGTFFQIMYRSFQGKGKLSGYMYDVDVSYTSVALMMGQRL